VSPERPTGRAAAIAVTHIFPADGDYVFKMAFEPHEPPVASRAGALSSSRSKCRSTASRWPCSTLDQGWMTVADSERREPGDRADPRDGRAHQLAAAFVMHFEGPIEGPPRPRTRGRWTDREIGSNGNTGITQLPPHQGSDGQRTDPRGPASRTTRCAGRSSPAVRRRPSRSVSAREKIITKRGHDRLSVAW
jgi:hypothetical protein